jgi:hypothetical protein
VPFADAVLRAMQAGAEAEVEADGGGEQIAS